MLILPSSYFLLMISNISAVRQIAWIALIPQFLFAVLLIVLWHFMRVPDPPLYGLVSYFLISFGLRKFIPHHHNKGMKLVKQAKFEQAITEFERSYGFFSKNLWIDKYRYITLLSSSAMSYREMSLTNIGLCYAQLADTAKAKDYYEKTLIEFPDSRIAREGLNLLDD